MTVLKVKEFQDQSYVQSFEKVLAHKGAHEIFTCSNSTMEASKNV